MLQNISMLSSEVIWGLYTKSKITTRLDRSINIWGPNTIRVPFVKSGGGGQHGLSGSHSNYATMLWLCKWQNTCISFSSPFAQFKCGFVWPRYIRSCTTLETLAGAKHHNRDSGLTINPVRFSLLSHTYSYSLYYLLHCFYITLI